jgi:exosortase N
MGVDRVAGRGRALVGTQNAALVMNRNRLSIALLLWHLAVAVFWIAIGYLRSDLTFLAGLLLLPAITLVRQPGTGSWRFAVLAMLCAGLALAIPARTFHFGMLAFSALFLFENWQGKINAAPVLVVLLLTAVVKTMSIVLGFGIRLELSNLAANALQLAGWSAQAEGNIIRFEGRPFSVDPACMGLQMVDISFLFCFFLLALLERRSGRRLTWPVLLGVLIATAGLNVAFNFLRILLLVILNIAPDTSGHDLAGLVGLAVYVFLPLWWGLRWVYGQWGVTVPSDPLPRPAGKIIPLWPTLILTGVVTYFAFTQHQANPEHVTTGYAVIQPAGIPATCPPQQLADGVVQYTTDSLLVYVKPIRGFYSTEHTPLICWAGSGYQFGQVWEAQCGGTAYYTGVLKKKDDQLYTAWWYDNGHIRTISQTRWRWLDLGGAAGFSLVNVTARDKGVLERQLQAMLK